MQQPESVQEIIDDPTRFGLPTFDEFCRNPDAYRNKAVDLLATASDSSQVSQMRNLIKKQEYSWNGQYRTKNLEEIERIYKSEGYTMDDLDMEAQILPEQDKAVMLLNFFPRRKGKIELPYGA